MPAGSTAVREIDSGTLTLPPLYDPDWATPSMSIMGDPLMLGSDPLRSDGDSGRDSELTPTERFPVKPSKR